MEFLIGADNVDIYVLDHLVTRHTFYGKPRPRLLPAQINGLMKGFIDLVFVHNQQYYVADYKFNGLGNNDAAYTEEAMETAMLSKRYDLQYALYLLALHRLLKAGWELITITIPMSAAVFICFCAVRKAQRAAEC